MPHVVRLKNGQNIESKHLVHSVEECRERRDKENSVVADKVLKNLRILINKKKRDGVGE